jgi:predicted Fe-Mo cluster-binding NifX family protein
MFKLGIPVFLNRIAPRLDCARKLLVLGIEGDRLVARAEFDISHWPPNEKITHLERLGVEKVICGGLRLEDKADLQRLGIQVLAPVFGEVDRILQDYLEGQLERMACCQGQRQRRRRRSCIR